MARLTFLLGPVLLFLLAASSVGAKPLPIRPVPEVDIARFMGQWHLVGGILTPYERNAWNAIQTYTFLDDGRIRTALAFNQGQDDGPLRQIEALAKIRPGTGNAVWDVQVFGPLKAQYVVAWLREDYGAMIVARDDRDYAWYFSRSRTVTTAEVEQARSRIQALGYDGSRWTRVNHAPGG